MVSQNVDFSGLPEIALLNKVEPTRDYPSSFEALSDWRNQRDILHEVFDRKLNPDRVKAQAGRYLAGQEIWKLTFPFLGSPKPVLDGLLVFANPFAVAQKFGIGDLAEDLCKATKGEGLWGALCETILFPILAKQAGGFINYRAKAMGSDRFLPLQPVAQWLWHAYQKDGDFICRPCSAGRCMAGYAVETSLLEVSRYDGIVTPAWANGQLLVTHQHIITPQSLFQDVAGDCYRFVDARTFAYAPYFDRLGATLGFGTDSVGDARGSFGTVFVLRE